MRHLFTTLLLLGIGTTMHAQEWTKADSVRLSALMSGDGEVKINRNAILQIDFGGGTVGSPMMSEEKQWLEPDGTLPSAIDNGNAEDIRKYLTLHPYTADTPCNWDPVRRRKFKVDKDTWRSDPYYMLTSLKRYTNWAKNCVAPGKRETLEQIEATGLRYNPLADHVNGMATGRWEFTPSAPTGYDFMTPFTKEFWHKKARLRRLRTLEVLSQYGDSTTVAINRPIVKSAQ